MKDYGSYSLISLKVFPIFFSVIKHNQHGIAAVQEDYDSPQPTPLLIICEHKTKKKRLILS